MSIEGTVSIYIEDFQGVEELEVEVSIDVEPSVRGSFRYDAASDIDYHGCPASCGGVTDITVIEGERVDGKWKSRERLATPEEANIVFEWIKANEAEWDKLAAEAAEAAERDDYEMAMEAKAEAMWDARYDF